MEAIETIEKGISLLNDKQGHLVELAKKFAGLKVNGIGDREGFAVLTKARKELKGERVQIEKDAKDLREGAVKFQKAVIAKEKELIALIKPTEDALLAEEKRIESEVEAIRVEQERKENERIQNRINQLAKFNHAIDLYDAKVMSDEKFTEFLATAEADFKVEQDRIAAEAKAKKDEEERLNIEAEERRKKELEDRRIEDERLQKQREDQERIRLEQEKKEQEIREQQSKLEAERKKLEEEKRLEEAKKEAAEKARLEEQQRIKREEEEKVERERLAKIEAERQEALKPDKEKIFSFAKSLRATELPQVKDSNSQELINWIGEQLVSLTDEISHRTNQL